MDLLKKYLLSSVARFSPPDPPAAEGGEAPDGDERIEPDAEDDEAVGDPVDDGEPAEGEEAELEDPAGEAEGGEEIEDDGALAADAKPQSRAERRIQALTERNRQQAEENARVTRELAEARRAPAAPVETPAQRAERWALLSPEDRAEERVTTALAAHEQKNNALTAQLMDQSDQNSFEAKTATNPLLKKLAPEVERRLADLRSRGQNLPRAVVATYLIGERALAQQGKAKPAVAARQRQQASRPVNGRGDTVPDRRNRGDSVAAMEKRLENQSI